jgi:clan AA aspartic protease (TIGR02281 family)
MRRFVLAAALLVSVAPSALAEASCELKKYGTIPFETDDKAHIYVPATIAGRSTRLLLDTGAYWSVLRRDFAEAQNLRIGNALYFDLYDIAGHKMDRMTTADAKLGSLGYGETEFFISKPIEGRSVDQDAGVIGQNMLAKIDLEIDNAGKTISLFSQEHCKGAGVHWADEAVTLSFRKKPAEAPINSNIKRKNKNQIDMPIVAADLEGETVSVLFDTGATYTTIDLDHAERRFGIKPGAPGVEPDGKLYAANGEARDAYKYTFKSLTISGIKFENVPVRLAKLDNTAQVLFGMNELKKLRLYFAFNDGMIHITAADARRTPQ